MAPDDNCYALNNWDNSGHQFGQLRQHLGLTGERLIFDRSLSAAAHKRNAILQHEYYTWGLKWNPHAEWMSYFCDCEHYLPWPTCAATHTHTTQHTTHKHRVRAGYFLGVILATDSGPVIVSSAAGSEASLSYWLASVSHWAKTQGWWHCRWEHVNFAL